MRVLLFGVDGLTFRILEPFMERGLLPNFQRLRDEGVQGILQSTIPPMTPPAWMSISTGLPLAKHGVYDFWGYTQTEDGPTAHIVTHRSGGRAIWNVLSDWGKHVVVANVPMTYPPEPVNGFMLSGYMAPDMQANVTYPASLKEELLEAVPDYQIDLNPAVSSGQIGNPLAETLKMTRERIAMLRLFLDKPWDFCFVAFSGADRIQHLCWDRIVQFDPEAMKYYQMLDDALGLALEALGNDGLLMVVSDHGFQGTRRRFYIQEYLYRQGLIRMRDSGNRRRAEIQGFIKGAARTLGLRRLAHLVRKQMQRAGIMKVVQEHHAVKLPDLDWEHTQAWVPSSSGSMAGYADIFLHESLSEARIDELVADLQALRDPENGGPLIKEVYREDIFGDGPFAPGERHLLLLAHEHIVMANELGRKPLWEPSDPSFGIHHPDGVLYLYGAGVKRGTTMSPAHIFDVVPTILSYMDVSLPDDLSGIVMHDAFEQPSFQSADLKSDGVVMRKLKKLASGTM